MFGFISTVIWILTFAPLVPGASDPPGTAPPSVVVAVDLDEAGTGSPVVTRLHHDAEDDNTVKSIATQTFPPTGGTPVPQAPQVYDIGGNLVWDGTYFYTYDAWSRLVAVHYSGTLTVNSFAADGTLVSNASPGPWMRRLTYDAVGRLVRLEMPVVPSQTAPDDPVRLEDYRYDGVRRIQEIVFRQEAIVVEELGSGGEGIEEPKDVEPLDPLLPLEVVTALPAGWDQREYVWGPDYVDELAWEIAHPKSSEQQQAHPNGIAYYAVLDANYNVMALLRSTATGAGETIPSEGGTGVNGAFVPGDVAVQYVWSPYGECLASEVFDDAAPLNPVGHQGLFYIRLNGKVTDKPHEPYHAGFYYNRNRMYEPASGRFAQRDMNATGSPVLGSVSHNGGTPRSTLRVFAPAEHYGDGMNLTQYCRSAPSMNLDPSGLFTLAEFGAAQYLSLELDQMNLETGLSFMGSFQGLKMMAEERNADLDLASELAAQGNMDEAEAFMEAAQRMRYLQFAAYGVMGAGALTKLGVASLRAGTRVLMRSEAALAKLLAGYSSRRFPVGQHVLQLDKSGLKHILERHHPLYWDGSTKAVQTFFSRNQTVDELQSIIEHVLTQNRNVILRRGSQGLYQIRGSVNGRTYVVGLSNGRIGQLYPE